MTQRKKTMQLVVAMAIFGSAMASAQGTALGSIAALPGLEMQTNASTNLNAQGKDDLFAGAEKFAKGASEVTEVNLDPTTMGMVGRATARGDKDGSMARKMNFMSIRTYQYDKPGMYSMDEVEVYRRKLTDGSWNCSIHVRDKTGSTDICSRTGSDHETNEMVILTAESKELTFIHMSGKMSLADLSRMSSGSRVLPLPPMPPASPIPPSAKTLPLPPSPPVAPH